MLEDKDGRPKTEDGSRSAAEIPPPRERNPQSATEPKVSSAKPIRNPKSAIRNPILLFDGVCNLCNRLVVFVIRRDSKARIRFASLQSGTGKSILTNAGLSPDSVDTVVYFSGDKVFLRSSAVLNLLYDIGAGWKLFYSLIIIPSFIRDFLYNLIAKNRYRIFGRRETCMVPSKDIESRFLL